MRLSRTSARSAPNDSNCSRLVVARCELKATTPGATLAPTAMFVNAQVHTATLAAKSWPTGGTQRQRAYFANASPTEPHCTVSA